MSLNELKSTLQAAGIVGAGGAGFPSYAKLAEGADTLVINAAECEPLIYTDYMLMRESLPWIVAGAQYVMKETGITTTLLGVKAHRAEMLGYTEGQKLADGVFVKLLRDAYPMGDEINLIFETTGRVVAPGSLPITAGVIVLNAETLCNISAAVEKCARRHKLGIVRDYVGHGCGIQLHEAPEVPNYTGWGKGPRLEPGMVLCIEPMLNLGTDSVKLDRTDHWTVRTADGKLSAHFEHMILITDNEPEILTWQKTM